MRFPVGLLVLAALAGPAAGRASMSPAMRSRPAPLEQAPEPPTQEVNERYVEKISQRIAGREKQPAGSVFENVQLEWLKTVPAGRFLRIMKDGYSRALGVRCTHCHLEDDFASDDRRAKRAAREMAVMHHEINGQLRRMENLDTNPEERAINCTTCHRGNIDPMADRR